MWEKRLRHLKLMVTSGSLLLARSNTHMPSSGATTDSSTSKKVSNRNPFLFWYKNNNISWLAINRLLSPQLAVLNCAIQKPAVQGRLTLQLIN